MLPRPGLRGPPVAASIEPSAVSDEFRFHALPGKEEGTEKTQSLTKVRRHRVSRRVPYTTLSPVCLCCAQEGLNRRDTARARSVGISNQPMCKIPKPNPARLP
jgi:hypothetical protein